MKISDLYQQTTNRIIEELKEGVPPWTRPWKDDRRKGLGMIPSNLVSGRLYSGSNILLLWMSARLKGYESLQFCTYKQAQDIGASIRKNEKSTHVIFTKHVRRKNEDTGEEKPSTIVKSYSVFHVSQLENVPEAYLGVQETEDSLPAHERALQFVRGTGAKFLHGSNKACYVPVTDEIHLPSFSAFHDEPAYWGTVNHELTHWTGHTDRLNRKFGKRFGDREYAAEELVAELGSAFLCARLGFTPTFRSASYIESWLKVLEKDNRAVFSAASYAGHAADWLWKESFGEESPEQDEQEEPEKLQAAE